MYKVVLSSNQEIIFELLYMVNLYFVVIILRVCQASYENSSIHLDLPDKFFYSSEASSGHLNIERKRNFLFYR